MAKEEELFLDLLPESEKERFNKAEVVDPKKPYKNEMQVALQNLLNGTYVNTRDGAKLSVKQLLMMKTVGYTLANPAPQNVKVLCEMAGESTKVDVTSGGKSIDEVLKGMAINNGKNS